MPYILRTKLLAKYGSADRCGKRGNGRSRKTLTSTATEDGGTSLLRPESELRAPTASIAQLRDIICDQFGVKAKDVVPSASFVDDLVANWLRLELVL